MRGSLDAHRPAWTLMAIAALVLAASAFAVDDQDATKKLPPARKPAASEAAPTPEAEADALAFVRENHPELAGLLRQLKPMRPAEYERAIRELATVSKNLAAVKARNPEAYERGLGVWKARSRVELLTARLASAQGASPELERQLHQAVEEHLDAEIRQQSYERDRAAERLKKVQDNLDRLQSRRGAIVESRYQAFVKKGQRARQQPKRPKAGDDANAGSKAKPKATDTKGGPQP